MLRNDGLVVFVSEMPSPVVFWIVPPELSPPCDVLPSPVTVRLPVEPVLLRTMPFARAVGRDAPEGQALGADGRVGDVQRGAGRRGQRVVRQRRAVGVGDGDRAAGWWQLKAAAAPVESAMPPSKRMVAPVLPVRSMPPPLVEVRLPLKSTVPPVRPETSTRSPGGGLVDGGVDGDVRRRRR